MALSQIEEKYINTTLADMLEQVLIYKSKIDADRSNARDRAIWRALYIHSIKTYNRALGTLGLVGTSNLARAQKPYSDRLLREKGYEFIDDSDIEFIVTEAYGLSKLQRQIERYELQKKMAKAFIVGSNSSKKVQQALITLAQHGDIEKIIPLDKLVDAKHQPTIDNLPRGNPRKGGLVKKYVDQGYNLVDANRLADIQILEEEAGVELYNEEKQATKAAEQKLMDDAIAQAYKNIPQKDMNQVRAEKALAFLNDADPEQIDKDKTPSLADLNPLEGEGGFK